MPTGELNHIINTDIYLIDQILKGRYNTGGKLLDAGCGGGRNISWFIMQPNFDIYAIDSDQNAIDHLLKACLLAVVGRRPTTNTKNLINVFLKILSGTISHGQTMRYGKRKTFKNVFIQ